MSHPFEIVVTLCVAVIVIGTAIVAPRPKPEPPAEPQRPAVEVALAECAEHPDQPCHIQVEPWPPKTDQQRIKTLEKSAEWIAAEQDELAERIKALTEEVKKK